MSEASGEDLGWIEGKDRRLEVLSPGPLVVSTPVGLLAEKRITDKELAAGVVTVSGVAYNDGSARLQSVLVSVDRGQSWQLAEFQAPESPYAWYQWRTQVNLEPAIHEIWSRAFDALGRTQPLDGSVSWNPNGYEWAGVFKTEVTVA